MESLEPDKQALPEPVRTANSMTSVDKALEVCEVLSGASRGMSLSDLARALRQPAPTVHRLLAVLKKRGYVRQDDESQRYGLTLKMLDLSFRSLGQSELQVLSAVNDAHATRADLVEDLVVPESLSN